LHGCELDESEEGGAELVLAGGGEQRLVHHDPAPSVVRGRIKTLDD
jgi:hypothetical protein